MALRPGSGGGSSFMYPVGGGLGPPQGMVPMPQQQPQPQQGFPMVPVMQPNMQGMMGVNFGGQMPPGAIPMQGGIAIGMQAPGMPFLGQPQFMGMRPAGPQYTADMQKQMAEEHQKRLEQQQKMLEEDRKRRQFEEQKQKLRLLSSVKPKTGEKSRDDALEAIKGNLDGFSRDAKMHPTPSSQTKKPGPSLEEKLFSSCDLTADKSAQVSFKSKQSLAQMAPRARVSSQFSASPKARNWASATEDLSSVFVTEKTQEAAASPPDSQLSSAAQSGSESGVAVYPQQEHIQSIPPAWVYNDSLVPDMFKKVLDLTMTPAGIDTGKLYPILMSSGLPREALGQIWASANRTTPGMLTKEELYTVLALIGVAQTGLPVLNVEILSQFPSPPLPNLPGLAMALAPVIPPHQQPMMTHPPVSMSMATPAAPVPVMAMAPTVHAPPPTNPGFIATFPPGPAAQGSKADDDDFQEFQGAPKAGAGDQAFADFQGESGGSFPTAAAAPAATHQHPNSTAAMLTPVSGSSSSSGTSSDKYAVFKQLSADQPAEPAPPVSDAGDKYSVFRQLEQPADKKTVGEGFADFKSVNADDSFTDFKTADSVSPLDPSDQAKIFPPAFPSAFPNSQTLQQQPAVSLSQPKNPLNMADLDLFSSVPASTEKPPSTFPPVSLGLLPGGAKPPSDDFGDFALFGSSSESAPAAAVAAGGAAAATQDDFADFMAFGSSGGEPRGEGGAAKKPQQGSDKYDVLKQLSLEGAVSYDEAKESGVGGGGSFSSLRSDADDFADFQSSKFCTALGASEKTLVDKVAAFKHGKEDSASIKSLDLPSIGGSSAGKDDSEDALSVQLDMKLSDMGGDLKHVMSDSSLDLPGLSAHQPPATERDDMKFDPFGTSALSTLSSYDWSDRDENLASDLKKPQGMEGASLSSLVPSQRNELSFGSTENMSNGSPAKVMTSLASENGSSGGDKFEAFADFGSSEQPGDDNDFGDFASTVSEKSDSPAVTTEAGSEGNLGEFLDEFGTFQGDKPKFDKFDFLKASAQTKVKSSEEMIKNELATFDLSVQGSHKRSHSLGEKEIGRSPPSPAPEQPFRDRSNTLNEKPTLPVIRDKYKDLTGEVEESERYAYEWQRCLESALEVITKANNTLNGISSSSVCTEVIQSAQGMEYLLGVVEVYRVTRRVELGIKATAVCSEKLQQLLKDISRVWNNLIGFMSLAKLVPDESSLDFSSCILRPGIKNAKELACGVCLLNVDARSKNKEGSAIGRLLKRAFNSETDNFKLLYGGHQYHASCANFWINCVEPKPPGLILPDLL
uniref:Synergin gamma n=1 Tax=Xiphophorus maculatus TaxID=8083 RepID=M4ABK0_XIPMA